MAAEFAASITEGRAPRTDGQAGLRVLSVLEAATRSLEDSGNSAGVESTATRAEVVR